jgi:hypothetical protein
LQWILKWIFNTTWFQLRGFLVPFIAKWLQNHCKTLANFAFSSSDSIANNTLQPRSND